MPAISVYENWNWKYADALDWMTTARDHCSRTGEMAIGVGSHSADLVTLGRHANNDEIIDAEYLRKHGVDIFRIDRGGGATLHGPGQIVLYPVVSLEILNLTIPAATSLFESAIIDCLSHFGIHSHLLSGEPGVFVDGAKIGSIGLRVSQKIVTHGISLNVFNNLSLYTKITPCSKASAAITSITALVGEKHDARLVGRKLTQIIDSAIIATLAPAGR